MADAGAGRLFVIGVEACVGEPRLRPHRGAAAIGIGQGDDRHPAMAGVVVVVSDVAVGVGGADRLIAGERVRAARRIGCGGDDIG